MALGHIAPIEIRYICIGSAEWRLYLSSLEIRGKLKLESSVHFFARMEAWLG
jgi:hypothetical protein